MVEFAELLTANRFYLELKLDGGNEAVDATFLECQGFKRSQEAIAICEVTPQQWGRAKSGRVVDTKIPGSAKTENIILRRGMTHSMTLWNWFEAIETGNWAKQLRDGAVNIYDQAGQVRARFEFRGAWPTRYTAADLSAQSTEMEIEELEMVVESFIRKK
ncbi:MAG: phage tail protein [Synechococcales bacterium]|nr:phage tail protein [Synechococcales bacterium]